MKIVFNPPASWPFNAITIWPFVFVRYERRDDAALYAHELVHLRRQLQFLLLPWWVGYLCNENFRVREEVLGYAEQIRQNGITVDRAAWAIKSLYRVRKHSLDDVSNLIKKEL